MLDDGDIDVAFLTETWLTSISNPTTAELRDAGFLTIHTIRKGDIKGGGTMVICKKLYAPKQLHLGNFRSFEYAAAKLALYQRPLLLISLYRLKYFPRTNTLVPLSLFLEEFQSLLESLQMVSEDIIVAGDFNLHFEKNTKTIDNFSQLVSIFNLSQGVSGPTHNAGHTLDLVLFNNVSVVDYDLCVHSCIYFDINSSVQTDGLQPEPSTFRKIKEINLANFKEDLNSKLQVISPTSNLELPDLVGSFNNILSNILNKHAPLMEKNPKNISHPMWFDGEFLDLRRQRRHAEKVWRTSRLEIHREIYVNLRTKVADLSIIKRQNYLSNRIENSSNSLRDLFNICHNLLGNESNYVLPDLYNGDTDKIAGHFSKYFNEKIVNIRNNIELDNVPSLGGNQTLNYCYDIKNDDFEFSDSKPHALASESHSLLFELSPTTEDEIRSILKGSGVKTGMLDPLPTALMKISLESLIPVLVTIVNKSLTSGSMNGLKDSFILPLLKETGLDPDDLKNYRPITNLSFLSKLIERVVLDRLNTHMSANNLHIPNQSGYKKGHSCETLLLKITNDILVGIDKNNATVVLLLDLSAAFDTVDHNKLIHILSSEIGLRGTCLKWFKSFLTGRSQRVRAGNSLSDDTELEFGVPQGSVLGPVLFNIYMRSLYQLVMKYGFDIQGYADDNQLYSNFHIDVQYHTLRVKIPQIFSIVTSWMKTHFLKLNPSKSELIIFHTPATEPFICISRVYLTPGINLTTLPHVKLLGVKLDTSLNYDTHITSLLRSTYNLLRNVANVRIFLTTTHIKTLVNAIIVSKLDYCNSLLYGISSYNINRLQVLQNSAARVIYGRKKREHASDILNELHWLRVDARIHFKLLCTVYKCLHDANSPPYLKSLLTFKYPIPKILSVPRTHTTFADRAFSVAGPKLWNALPIDIRLSTTLDNFKSSLKTYFFTRFDSFINEVTKLKT